MKTIEKTKEEPQTVILDSNQLICILDKKVHRASEKEKNLQAVMRRMNEEYHFPLEDMERDFMVRGLKEDGKKWSRKIELVIFASGTEHVQDNIIRLIVVQNAKRKESDPKQGVAAALEAALGAVEGCEFGLWTNEERTVFLQKEMRALAGFEFVDLSDFPGEGESLEDLNRSDRTALRNPANDSLIRTFKRCQDYMYGNEGRQKDGFWQLLFLIFCKIHDEKEGEKCRHSGETYRRKFWVGVKEANTREGQEKVAARIHKLFDALKSAELYGEVFQEGDEISLTPRGIAFVVKELSKYSFLDATVDVKGTAYETIVSNTLKQERGQFFTPRNVVKCMVEMMNPQEGERILDPACGSGGFLVMALDHVRRQMAREQFPELSGKLLEAQFNDRALNERLQKYAREKLFGIDFDPDLKRAARMNMIMAGDGHTNIFHLNSLEYPSPEKAAFEDQEKLDARMRKLLKDAGELRSGINCFGTFDVIFTNPPFGSKIPINDVEVLSKYELARHWQKGGDGKWRKLSTLQKSQPPEILFIEACWRFLKPGGRMGIVLPDGILSNPQAEYVRAWIMSEFKVLASIDLPSEAFLPQVEVQSSLLFLKKKTREEKVLAHLEKEDYRTFMAIVEKVGKNRRGTPIYRRDVNGVIIYEEREVEYLKKHNTKLISIIRKENLRQLADDLPEVSKAYRNWINKKTS